MITMNMLSSIMFTSTKHPITMIISMTTFTISSSTIMFTIHNNAWLSYTITLIMIGGMMIIFIYMASINPNKKITMSLTTIIYLTITWLTINNYNITITHQKMSINQIMEMSPTMTTIIMGIYLLFTLMMINKATSHFEGPMQTNI